MSPSSSWFLSLTLSISLVHLARSGCPFASMIGNTNFSGDWSYNVSHPAGSEPEAYVLHICHLDNHEVYFGMAKNDTPEVLMGFGFGNWSQGSMMLGGQLFEAFNGSTASHDMGVGMNMDVHKWWLKTPVRSTPMEQGKAYKALNYRLCAIPHGVWQRRLYWSRFWESKRSFSRELRVKKRMRDRSRKRRAKKLRRKSFYQRYYQLFLEFIGWLSTDEALEITDEELNAEWNWDESPSFPTLFGKTWHNPQEGVTVTLIDSDNACFNGEQITNLSVAYYGTAVNSFVEKPNGIRNGQMFVQLSENEVLASSITFKMNDDGQVVRDQVKQFTLEQADAMKPCSAAKAQARQVDGIVKGCDRSQDQKCEL